MSDCLEISRNGRLCAGAVAYEKRIEELEAEHLETANDLFDANRKIEELEATIERVRGLAEKGNCTGIPSGGEHDELVMVYVVKRSDLLAAIKGDE